MHDCFIKKRTIFPSKEEERPPLKAFLSAQRFHFMPGSLQLGGGGNAWLKSPLEPIGRLDEYMRWYPTDLGDIQSGVPDYLHPVPIGTAAYPSDCSTRDSFKINPLSDMFAQTTVNDKWSSRANLYLSAVSVSPQSLCPWPESRPPRCHRSDRSPPCCCCF